MKQLLLISLLALSGCGITSAHVRTLTCFGFCISGEVDDTMTGKSPLDREGTPKEQPRDKP